MPRDERRLAREERRRHRAEALAQRRAGALEAESRRYQSFEGGGGV